MPTWNGVSSPRWRGPGLSCQSPGSGGCRRGHPELRSHRDPPAPPRAPGVGRPKLRSRQVSNPARPAPPLPVLPVIVAEVGAQGVEVQGEPQGAAQQLRDHLSACQRRRRRSRTGATPCPARPPAPAPPRLPLAPPGTAGRRSALRRRPQPDGVPPLRRPYPMAAGRSAARAQLGSAERG